MRSTWVLISTQRRALVEAIRCNLGHEGTDPSDTPEKQKQKADAAIYVAMFFASLEAFCVLA